MHQNGAGQGAWVPAQHMFFFRNFFEQHFFFPDPSLLEYSNAQKSHLKLIYLKTHKPYFSLPGFLERFIDAQSYRSGWTWLTFSSTITHPKDHGKRAKHTSKGKLMSLFTCLHHLQTFSFLSTQEIWFKVRWPLKMMILLQNSFLLSTFDVRGF